MRGLVGVEALLVGGAIFVAAILTSLAPPPPSFALQNSALAKVGPGRVVKTVHANGYDLQVLVSPNKAAAPDSFALRITKDGKPVRGADVSLTFDHTEMQMPQQEYGLVREAARRLFALDPGAGHGRPVGPGLPDHPTRRTPVHGPDPRPGERMTANVWLKLIASTLALVAGLVAVVIAVVLVSGTV